MKKLSLIATALLVILFTSCQENGLFEDEQMNLEEELAAELAEYDAISETVIETSFEEIDESTNEIITTFYALSESSGGRTTGWGNGENNNRGIKREKKDEETW